jgi:hypothetical protein
VSPEPAVVRGSNTRPREGGAAVLDAWRWIGWLGLALTVVAVGDLLLTWIPLQVGSPEWEFGTIAASFSGLPLVTIGLAALLGSALARGIRWQLTGLAVVLIALALAVVGALIVFVLVVPVALSAVEGPARTGILKAIVRTALLGLVFSMAYAGAAIGALRQARKS